MGTGVSAFRLCSQVDDSDMLDRRAHAKRAKDNLSKKFGQAAVMRGITYDGAEKAERRPTYGESHAPFSPLLFRDGSTDQTRNLEVLRCAIAHHSSMLRIAPE
jgi:hypothetical protein